MSGGNWRGTWSATELYQPKDIVHYRGQVYLCLELTLWWDVPGTATGEGKWVLYALSGASS